MRNLQSQGLSSQAAALSPLAPARTRRRSMAAVQSEATPAPAASDAAPVAAAPAPAVSEEVAAEAKRIKDEGNAFFAGESRSWVGARPFKG